MFTYTDKEIHKVRDELLEWMRNSGKRRFTTREVYGSVDYSAPLVARAITHLVATLRITDTVNGYRLCAMQ